MTFDLRSYLLGLATWPALAIGFLTFAVVGAKLYLWRQRMTLPRRVADRMWNEIQQRKPADPVTPAVPQGDGDSTPISSRIVVEPWRNTGLHSHVRNAHWLRPIDAAAFNVLQHHYNNDHEADGA